MAALTAKEIQKRTEAIEKAKMQYELKKQIESEKIKTKALEKRLQMKKRAEEKEITKVEGPLTLDMTASGHRLRLNESKFINEFMICGSAPDAAERAGYTDRNKGAELLRRNYIVEELKYRLDSLKKDKIADADEVMQYFTSVMRGQVKDQFGLDAPLSERTSAAKELAKRTIDGVSKNDGSQSANITLKLDWSR